MQVATSWKNSQSHAPRATCGPWSTGRRGLRIAGSGDVRIGAPATLDISIAGSGDLSYRGKPRVTQRVAGSGNVTAR